jgi:hypothetical protein
MEIKCRETLQDLLIKAVFFLKKILVAQEK